MRPSDVDIREFSPTLSQRTDALTIVSSKKVMSFHDLRLVKRTVRFKRKYGAKTFDFDVLKPEVDFHDETAESLRVSDLNAKELGAGTEYENETADFSRRLRTRIGEDAEQTVYESK